MDKYSHFDERINGEYSIELRDADVSLMNRCNKAAYEAYGNPITV